MKKLALILLAFVLVASACKKDEEEEANAEFVSKTAEKKVALLEEFTGVRCGYCPQGAIIAAEIIAEHPGQAIAIDVHGGSYATPYPGDPELKTPWAAQLISFSQYLFRSSKGAEEWRQNHVRFGEENQRSSISWSAGRSA